MFHSLDKVTSLFLHLFPAAVAWTERWHPDVVRDPLPPCFTASLQCFTGTHVSQAAGIDLHFPSAHMAVLECSTKGATTLVCFTLGPHAT